MLSTNQKVRERKMNNLIGLPKNETSKLKLADEATRIAERMKDEKGNWRQGCYLNPVRQYKEIKNGKKMKKRESLTTKWQQDLTSEKILSFITQGANTFQCVDSNEFIIDVDNPKIIPGLKSFIMNTCPPREVVNTGRGMHLIYTLPKDEKTRHEFLDSVKRLIKGHKTPKIDILFSDTRPDRRGNISKGKGRYILGSFHPLSERTYAQDESFECNGPGEITISFFEKFIGEYGMDKMRKRVTQDEKKKRKQDFDAGLIPDSKKNMAYIKGEAENWERGHWHDTLTRKLVYAKKTGSFQTEIENILSEARSARPGEDREEEIEKMVSWVEEKIDPLVIIYGVLQQDENLEALENGLGIEVRKNTVKGSVEFILSEKGKKMEQWKERKKQTGEKLEDPYWTIYGQGFEQFLMNLASNNILEEKTNRDGNPFHVTFSIPKQKLEDALTAIAMKNPVDPILDWIKSLKWDEKNRLGALFSNCFGLKEDTILTQEAGRMLFVGLVKRQITPGIQFDFVFVLVGGQGIGKDHFSRSLLPAHFRDDYYSGNITLGCTDRKEFGYSIKGLIVCHIPEFVGMAKKTVEIIKAEITNTNDMFCEKWEKQPTKHLRRCVFLAGANDAGNGVLPPDITGNRRWIIIDLSEIGNKNCREKITKYFEENLEQLWAEAYAKRDTQKLYFSKDMKEMQEAEANKFSFKRNSELYDYIEGRLDELKRLPFQIADKFYNNQAYGSYEPLHPSIPSKHKGVMEIANILKILGFKSKRRMEGNERKRFWIYQEQ